MTNSSCHSYNTRYKNNYRSKKHKTLLTSFNVQVQGPIIWNKLLQYGKDSKSLKCFKNKLKTYFVHEYLIMYNFNDYLLNVLSIYGSDMSVLFTD